MGLAPPSPAPTAARPSMIALVSAPVRRPAPSLPLSRRLERPRLRVLSLGAGVQSTALALMAALGVVTPGPDCAVFADTGAEPHATYDHLAWLASPGVLTFPIHRVSAGDLRSELLDTACGVRGAWGRPPLFVRSRSGKIGMTRRQCTQDYKLDPIRRRVRELLGLKPRQRGPRAPVVEQWSARPRVSRRPPGCYVYGSRRR